MRLPVSQEIFDAVVDSYPLDKPSRNTRVRLTKMVMRVDEAAHQRRVAAKSR